MKTAYSLYPMKTGSRKAAAAWKMFGSKLFIEIPFCVDHAANLHEFFLFVDSIKNGVVFDSHDAILPIQRFYRLINAAGILKVLQERYGFIQCVKQVECRLWCDERLSNIIYSIRYIAIGNRKIRKPIYPPPPSPEACISGQKTPRHA